MKRIVIDAPAKINLALDVVGKRDDGYHLLETVFQSVSIYDRLTISLKDESGIDITCNIPYIPCNEKNLAYKTANAFIKKTGMRNGVSIQLYKRIPSQAGMGGGSSDAAAVLKGLNKLTGSKLTSDELCDIAVTLGADVPFFIYGGTAYAEGIGEKLETLPFLKELNVVVAKGRGGISTPEAYKRIDALQNPIHPNTQALRKALKCGEDIHKLWQYCGNIFEEITDLKDVSAIRNIMRKMGADFVCMSGSGSSVFGIFKSLGATWKCRDVLAKKYPFAVCCKTTDK